MLTWNNRSVGMARNGDRLRGVEGDDVSQELFERLLKDEGTRAACLDAQVHQLREPQSRRVIGYFAPAVNITGQPGFFCTQTGPLGSILTTSTGPLTSGAPASIST
jgi:hypothetical protein